MAIVDDERRHDPERVVAARDRQQAVIVAQVLDQRARLRLELEAEQQAAPAHFLEQLGIVADELLEPADQLGALVAHVGQDVLRVERIEHGLARGDRQRIAAIGRAVGADHHAPRRLLGGKAGAEREAAADALGRGDDIGDHAVLFIGEEGAAAAIAALDLVEGEDQVVLVAQRAQALHEFLRRDANAALALNRLDQEACGIRPDRRLGRFQIVELHVLEARQQRQEALVHLLLAGRADRRQGPAVEGLVEGDDLEPVGVAPILVIGARRLDRAFDRLGPRVGEEHRVGEGEVDQPLRQVLPLGTAVEVRAMHQRLGLALDRADQPGVRMAERIDRDAAGEIERAPAVLADEVAMLTAHGPEPAPGVHGHQRGDRHDWFLCILGIRWPGFARISG